MAWLLHPRQMAPSHFPPFSQSVRGILLPVRAAVSIPFQRREGDRDGAADPLLDRIFLGLEVTVSIPFWRRPPWAFGQEGGPLTAGLPPPQRKCEGFRESYESIVIRIISGEIFASLKKICLGMMDHKESPMHASVKTSCHCSKYHVYPRY